MCQRASGAKYERGPRTGVDIAKVYSSACLGYWSLTTSSALLKAAPMPRTTYGSPAGCASRSWPSAGRTQPLVTLLAVTGRSDRTKFRNQVLNPLIEARLIEMTLSDKPRSSRQRYRLTAKGREILKKQKENS